MSKFSRVQLSAVLNNLFSCLRQAQADAAVKAIVITGAGGKFSGGFDISQFQNQAAGEELSKLVNTSFLELVETGPKPTVAALSTIALGGGCELAVACNGRVATPGALSIDAQGSCRCSAAEFPKTVHYLVCPVGSAPPPAWQRLVRRRCPRN